MRYKPTPYVEDHYRRQGWQAAKRGEPRSSARRVTAAYRRHWLNGWEQRMIESAKETTAAEEDRPPLPND